MTQDDLEAWLLILDFVGFVLKEEEEEELLAAYPLGKKCVRYYRKFYNGCNIERKSGAESSLLTVYFLDERTCVYDTQSTTGPTHTYEGTAEEMWRVVRGVLNREPQEWPAPRIDLGPTELCKPKC